MIVAVPKSNPVALRFHSHLELPPGGENILCLRVLECVRQALRSAGDWLEQLRCR
jgi:hypothetical protein